MHLEFRDPADLPSASHRPDITKGMDSPEDLIADEVLQQIAGMALRLPPSIQREWFNKTVAAVAMEAIKTAVADGTLGEMLDATPDAKSDMEVATRLLAELWDSPTPRLDAKCLAFAAGMQLTMGITEVQIGEQEGVSKQVVCKRVKKFQAAFGWKPSRGMKSPKACATYSENMMGKRARPLPERWQFSGFFGRILAQAHAA